MPKVTNTRKQQAQELYDRLARGPALDLMFFSTRVIADDSVPELTKAQKAAVETYILAQYQLWARSWILGAVTKAVPELRKARADKAFGTA